MNAKPSSNPQPEQSGRKFPVAALVIGISGVVIIGIISVILAVWLLNGSSPLDNSRADAVNAQVNEKKNFNLNETAKIGPINFKVTHVERDATGSTTNTEWIVITATATLNGNRELGDLDNHMDDIELNGLTPDDQNTMYPNANEQFSATAPSTLTYTFKIARSSDAASQPLVLTYKTFVNKTDSPLVGSEGAKRIALTYTISLEK